MTAIQLRGGYTATDIRLGRLPEFDEKSRKFALRDLVPVAKQTVVKGKSWYCPLHYDQGIAISNVTRGWDPSGCTGFSSGMDIIASPKPVYPRIINPRFCFELYRLAQDYDEWEDHNYEGSSVLGVAKALAKLGFIGQYRWAFGIDDVLMALTHLGGVVVGSDWQNSMFDPRPNGLITVEGGENETAGGHAYFLQSIIVSKIYMRWLLGRNEKIRDCPLLRIHQTWGNDWGIKGDALIWADDLERLLKGISYPGEARITTAPFYKDK